MRLSTLIPVRSLRRSAAVMLAVASLASVFAVLGVASPAQAASCDGYKKYLAIPESASEFWIDRVCDDNRMHIYGKVYDTACDARSAYVEFWVYNENGWRYATPNYHAGGGCGTNSSFDYITGGDFYGQKRVKACVFARNFWGDSSWKCEWVA